MKVLLDGHGGDNAPLENILGAILAVNSNKSIEVAITGKIEELKPILDANYSGGAITIIDAREIITNDDKPTLAVRVKKDSSMVKALRICREDESYAGVVSAGNTGALLTASLFVVKRIKGISRPCLTPTWPTVDGGQLVVVDSGANVDCKPLQLQHFALMGSCYMKAMYGVSNPRVALINNGIEKGKGSELTRETYDLLEVMDNINFVGNIEARDLLFGDIDVAVCDGFVGNVALKSTEGTATAIMKILKNGIMQGGLRAKIGALLLKPTLRKLKKTLDVNDQAGGAFLGVEKIVVKAHGSSKAVSIAKCIEQVVKLKENDVVCGIKEALAAARGENE